MGKERIYGLNEHHLALPVGTGRGLFSGDLRAGKHFGESSVGDAFDIDEITQGEYVRVGRATSESAIGNADNWDPDQTLD